MWDGKDWRRGWYANFMNSCIITCIVFSVSKRCLNLCVFNLLYFFEYTSYCLCDWSCLWELYWRNQAAFSSLSPFRTVLLQSVGSSWEVVPPWGKPVAVRLCFFVLYTDILYCRSCKVPGSQVSNGQCLRWAQQFSHMSGWAFWVILQARTGW